MKRYAKILIINIFVLCVFMIMVSESPAIPNLQIYSPQGTYDQTTETWIIPSYNYELWIIGAAKAVYDVKLALAVPVGETGTISLSWIDPLKADYGSGDVNSLSLSKTGGMGYAAYRASYASGNPNPATYAFVTNSTPMMGDGASVPPHGVFPTDFYEYFIGDFGLSQTVNNYIPGDDTATAQGEIKKFYISVVGYSVVDIIAYDHIVLGKNKAQYKFTPFSHDGDSQVPEPTTMLLLGLGLMGLAGVRRKIKK